MVRNTRPFTKILNHKWNHRLSLVARLRGFSRRARTRDPAGRRLRLLLLLRWFGWAAPAGRRCRRGSCAAAAPVPGPLIMRLSLLFTLLLLLRPRPLLLPSIFLDHVSELYYELALFVLLTRLERVLLQQREKRVIEISLALPSLRAIFIALPRLVRAPALSFVLSYH